MSQKHHDWLRHTPVTHDQDRQKIPNPADPYEGRSGFRLNSTMWNFAVAQARFLYDHSKQDFLSSSWGQIADFQIAQIIRRSRRRSPT